MTIVIQQNSASLVTTADGNKPHCTVNTFNGKVFVFLRPGTDRQAIINVGTVRATMAPTDAIASWDIGFVQLINEPISLYYFAGSKSSEGSVILDFADKPSSYRLDSEKKSAAPFENDSKPTKMTAQMGPTGPIMLVIRAAMDDNPFDTTALAFPNFATNKDNFLIRNQRTLNLYTAFVARDKSVPGPFSILAYVTWHVAWDFTLTHRLRTRGPPVVTALKAEFKADPPVLGAPRDQNIARQIANASSGDELYDDAARDEIKEVANATANTSLIKCFKHWDASVGAASRFVP